MENAVASQEDTTPPVPPAPRATLVTILSRILLAITCLIVGGLSVTGVSLYRSRHALLEQGVDLVEHALGEALGVPVQIGGVGGPYWNGFDVYDVRILGSRRPGADVIATIPRLHAAYSLLEVLKLGRQPATLDAYDPLVTLSRDAKGHLDFQPTLKPTNSKPPVHLPNLPGLRLRIHAGTIRWQDQAMPRVPRFQTTLDDVSGEADLVNKRLSFTAQAHSGSSRLAVDGTYHLEQAMGHVRAQATHVSTATWIGYLSRDPLYTVTAGSARVGADMAWGPQLPFKLQGEVAIAAMSLDIKGLRRPVEQVDALATFDSHTIALPKVTGMLLGNRFSGSGRVLDLGAPKLKLAFTGGAQDVDVASLVPLVPDLAPYRLSGKGAATAVVSGTVDHPIVDGVATVSEGHVLDQTARAITGKIHVENNRVTVADWQANLNQGRIWGNSALTLEETPQLTTDADWSGIDLAGTLQPYLKQPLPLVGRLSGHVSVHGTTQLPVVDGRVSVADARYLNQAFSAASGSFTYTRNHWALPAVTLGVGSGTLSLTCEGTNDGVFAGRFLGKQWPLASFTAFGLGAPMAGTGAASGSFAGDWTHFDALQARGTAAIAQASLYDIPLDQGTTRFQVADRQLTLSDVSVSGAGGTLSGGARMALGSRPAIVHADFAGQHLDLAELAPVQAAFESQTGAIEGTVSATGSIDADAQGWHARVESLGTDIDAARFGHLQRVSGPLYFGHQRLTFPDLSVQIAPQAHATVQGSLGFDRRTPSADLEVSVPDASARAVLAAIHWEQLLQGTWIGHKIGIKEVLGSSKPLAALDDGIEQVVDKRGMVDLKTLLAHWNRHHLDPSVNADPYAASDHPFWQAVDGRLNLDFTMQGLVTAPEIEVHTALKDAEVYGHRLRSAHVTAAYRNQHLYVPVLDVIEAGSNGAAIQARGVLGSDGALAVYGQNLDLSWANPWLETQELMLGGRGGFTLLAKGDPSDPHLEIATEVKHGAIAPAGTPLDDQDNRFTFDRGEAKATYYRGRLSIDSARIQKDDKEARITGSLPLVPGLDDNHLDVALNLQGDSLGIVTAFTHGELQWKGGPGSAVVKLAGTMDHPALSGVIDLKGVSLHDRNLKDDVTDLQAYAVIGTDSVTVERANAVYGGGTLSASGRILLAQFLPDKLRLNVLARHVRLALSNDLYKGLVEASLDVNGSLKHPIIGGTAMVSDGKVDLAALVNGNASNGPTSGAAAVPIELQDLNLRIHDGVTVLGPANPIEGIPGARIFEANVQGGLTISGMLDHPQMRGLITIPRGTFTPLNNEFDIVSGSTIEFLGSGVDTNPATEDSDMLPTSATITPSDVPQLPPARLNIIAKGQVYDYNANDFPDQKAGMLQITATVTGSLSNMERKFESTNLPTLTQDQIEKVLGKESLITGIFNGTIDLSKRNEQHTIIVNEVSGFLSTASRKFFNPYTSHVQDFLQLESFGFDLVSPTAVQETALFKDLGVSPSLYTETRPLFGGISLSGRYTFQQDRNIYQAGLNYHINRYLSLQAGIDNETGYNPHPLFKDFNPSITVSTQRHF